MGYGVLPFALEHDCLMAFTIESQSSSEIVVNHLNSSQFPSQKLNKNPKKPPEHYANNYLKYFWAGYQAALLESSI